MGDLIIPVIMSDYCDNLSEDVHIHGAAAVLVGELAVEVHEELPELDIFNLRLSTIALINLLCEQLCFFLFFCSIIHL